MHYPDDPVITLDDEGADAGLAPRDVTDPSTDILHAVHVFGITPSGRLLLRRVPDADEHGVLSDGLWSTSAATVIRADEDRDDAALRLLAEDLDHEDGDAIYIGDTLDRADGDTLRLHSSYYAHIPHDHLAPAEDGLEFRAVNADDLDALLRTPEALSPWLTALLEHHRHTLPL